MTDWFSELNAKPAGEVDQPRDWFTEVNGGVQKSQPKPLAGSKEGWGEWAVKLPIRAYEAAKGQQDPAHSNLKSFDEMPASDNLSYKARTTVGAVGGMDDKAYGDIIQRSLGDKFIKRFKDANGYEIIEHMGPDGKPARAYVNKPGLDMNDVSRGVVGALPYVVGGAWMGGWKGASTLPGALVQGIGAGATSIAGDAATAAAGGEDAPNLPKAGITAIAGTVGTALAPFAGDLWRRFVTIPGLVDKNGQLTAKGVAAAKAANIDAAELQGNIAKEFAATYAKTGDAAASAMKAEAGAYGVETSLGQRTRDPMQLLREKGYRMGNYGDAAKQQITDLDARQAAQIERMVRGNGFSPVDVPKVKPSMLEQIAPNMPYASTNPSTLGSNIKSGVTSARGVAKAEARAAWEAVPDLVPKQEAFSDLAPTITNQLAGRRLSSATPQAIAMDDALAAYAKGENVAAGTKLVNQSPVQTVDDMRRHLKDMLFGAGKDNPADQAASKAIYDGFNEWVRTSAKKSLLNGEADKAANLFKAVDLTKEMHAIFRPTGQNYRPNAATRIMETVMNDATPERIVDALFSNPTKSVIKDGAVQALRSIERGLKRYTPDTAAETWNSIRVAHWSKLVQDRDGKLFSPAVMSKNIQSAVASHSSVMHTLYSPMELREIVRVSRVLSGVSWKDPNPSGTATASQGLMKELFGTLMRALPIGNTARVAAEFSGLPNRLRNAAGYVGANNAVSQTLRTTTNPNVVGYGTAATNALYRDR